MPATLNAAASSTDCQVLARVCLIVCVTVSVTVW